MKRLFLTFGLVIAFLISSFNVIANTIFDTASYQAPKTENIKLFKCTKNPSSIITATSQTYESCDALVKSYISDVAMTGTDWSISGVTYRVDIINATAPNYKVYFNATKTWSKPEPYNPPPAQIEGILGYILFEKNQDSSSCPPDAFPLYIFGVDNDGDGDDDQCYNPDELDNLSNCANQVGNMLPALTNLATKVCKTDPATGASCGYSKKDGDIVYKTDLEMNCFGDGENVPEYDPEPMPEPETCVKYNEGLMVCKGDLSKCDALGNCGDQCGFVNGELYCFEQCSGAECDQETPPPVNCETNPTAPVCVEEPDPDPEFCAANPTDPKCVDTPEPCTGADCPPDGGGGGTSIDLKPVVDELKGLNTKLDFTTSNTASTRNMGLLETAFDDESISELKSKTDDIKSQINSFYTSTKAEISSMFSFSTGGGAYEPITFAFTYGTYSSKIWEYFSQNVAYIAAAIMFLAYLMAARIVLE